MKLKLIKATLLTSALSLSFMANALDLGKYASQSEVDTNNYGVDTQYTFPVDPMFVPRGIASTDIKLCVNSEGLPGVAFAQGFTPIACHHENKSSPDFKYLVTAESGVKKSYQWVSAQQANVTNRILALKSGITSELRNANPIIKEPVVHCMIKPPETFSTLKVGLYIPSQDMCIWQSYSPFYLERYSAGVTMGNDASEEILFYVNTDGLTL